MEWGLGVWLRGHLMATLQWRVGGARMGCKIGSDDRIQCARVVWVKAHEPQCKIPGWSCQYYMLVPKIKPCTSQYKLLRWNCERLIISVIVYLMVLYTDNRGKSTANTCQCLRAVFIRLNQTLLGAVSHDNCADRTTRSATLHSNFCPINYSVR